MDMNISGSGMITSGEYENIGISGSAKGEGLISCKNFFCSGSAKLNGELRCEGKISASGSSSCGPGSTSRSATASAFILLP